MQHPFGILLNDFINENDWTLLVQIKKQIIIKVKKKTKNFFPHFTHFPHINILL